jgi:hypothetical protein
LLFSPFVGQRFSIFVPENAQAACLSEVASVCRKSAHLDAGEEAGSQYNRTPLAITLVHARMEKVPLVECNAGELTCRPLYSVAGENKRRRNVKNSVKKFFYGESSHEKLHAKSAVRSSHGICAGWNFLRPQYPGERLDFGNHQAHAAYWRTNVYPRVALRPKSIV